MVSSLRSRVSTLIPLSHKISVLWLASSDLLQIKLIFVPSQKRSRVELVLMVRARARVWARVRAKVRARVRVRARAKTRVKTRARVRVRDQHRRNCDQMTHPILLTTARLVLRLLQQEQSEVSIFFIF